MMRTVCRGNAKRDRIPTLIAGPRLWASVTLQSVSKFQHPVLEVSTGSWCSPLGSDIQVGVAVVIRFSVTFRDVRLDDAFVDQQLPKSDVFTDPGDVVTNIMAWTAAFDTELRAFTKESVSTCWRH